MGSIMSHQLSHDLIIAEQQLLEGELTVTHHDRRLAGRLSIFQIWLPVDYEVTIDEHGGVELGTEQINLSSPIRMAEATIEALGGLFHVPPSEFWKSIMVLPTVTSGHGPHRAKVGLNISLKRDAPQADALHAFYLHEVEPHWQQVLTLANSLRGDESPQASLDLDSSDDPPAGKSPQAAVPASLEPAEEAGADGQDDGVAVRARLASQIAQKLTGKVLDVRLTTASTTNERIVSCRINPSQRMPGEGVPETKYGQINKLSKVPPRLDLRVSDSLTSTEREKCTATYTYSSATAALLASFWSMPDGHVLTFRLDRIDEVDDAGGRRSRYELVDVKRSDEAAEAANDQSPGATGPAPHQKRAA